MHTNQSEQQKIKMDDNLKLALQKFEVRLGVPKVFSGDMLITGDWHIPFTDFDFANLAILVGKKHLKKPRKLCIAGDWIDLSNFSAYVDVVEMPTWAQERDCAREVLKGLLSVFDEIHILMGNHERRLQKFTQGAFEESDILSLITTSDKVRMGNRGWCILNSLDESYRITHPKNYSINQLIVADQLALKYDQHIISFHEHHLGIGWDRYGRHLIVNGGGMVDPKKLAYVVIDDNKSAGMKNGFVLVKNGTPYLFGKSPFTDWSKWI